MVSVGANAKMNEFSAIMGILNLQNFDRAIADRNRVYNRYKELLNHIKGITIFDYSEDEDNMIRNYAYFPIIVENDYIMSRDELYLKLDKHNIHTRKYFFPITADQACFKNKYKESRLIVSRELSSKVLVLPIYEGLEDDVILDVLKYIS